MKMLSEMLLLPLLVVKEVRIARADSVQLVSGSEMYACRLAMPAS
jgi:hypothetical protein